MHEFAVPYQAFLESNYRYNRDVARSFAAYLPRIFNGLSVDSVREIDSQKVEKAWQYSRWQQTSDGIVRQEKDTTEYLASFKAFLEYLEKSGYAIEQGLANLVKLPRPYRARLGGLTWEEQLKLHEYLVQNVNTATRRRDAAFTFFMLAGSCHIEEALAVTVAENGLIETAADRNSDAIQSGDFTLLPEGHFVDLRAGGSGPFRRVPIPSETIYFLNFYLENRKADSQHLFTRDSGKNPADPLSAKTAGTILRRVFTNAGLNIEPDLICDIIRNTEFG